MSVFDGLVGQEEVRVQLERAALAAREIAEDSRLSSDSAMAQAWLITGPPGSGRSVAARMFAAALQCTGETPGCGRCQGCVTTMERNHPDVEFISTTGVVITVDQTRELIARSYVSPGTGKWRIFVVEDADRMAERTTNVLLKSIEEPPPFTVWLLCTPSPEDVMTTIRSRCREVHLSVPRAGDVAALLHSEGIDREAALNAALAAQSHIGRARGLATDRASADERRFVLREALSIRGTGDAVLAAHRVLNYKAANDPASPDFEPKAGKGGAKKGSKKSEDLPAALAEEFARETAALRRDLGISDDDGARVPPALRAQLRALDEDHKRRAKRFKLDRLDRALVDLLSLYRDVLCVQLGAQVELVNRDFSQEIEALAAQSDSEKSVRCMDAISQARTRLTGNVAPLLVLEAMMVALRPQG